MSRALRGGGGGWVGGGGGGREEAGGHFICWDWGCGAAAGRTRGEGLEKRRSKKKDSDM